MSYIDEIIEKVKKTPPRPKSKAALGMCREESCPNGRQTGSSRCKPCSDKHKTRNFIETVSPIGSMGTN